MFFLFLLASTVANPLPLQEEAEESFNDAVAVEEQILLLEECEETEDEVALRELNEFDGE